MFEQREVDAYKSIYAPESLRQSICSIDVHKERRKRTLKLMSTYMGVVACFVFVVIGSLPYLNGGNELDVYVNGNRVSKNNISIANETSASMAMRVISNNITVPLEVKHSNISMSTSDGQVIKEDETHFIWELFNPNKDSIYKLKLQERGKQKNMLLEFNKEENCWTVYLE